MSTQLKKGDKCQSPWGVIEIIEINAEFATVETKCSLISSIHISALTRIQSHAERMQSVLDVAWDVENRLQDDETVQLKVGAFVEFARHYVQLRDAIIDLMRGTQDRGNQAKIDMEKAEKLLKGETL